MFNKVKLGFVHVKKFWQKRNKVMQALIQDHKSK